VIARILKLFATLSSILKRSM